MEPTYGDYDRSDVKGIEDLKDELWKIEMSDSASERAELLAELLMNGHKGSVGYMEFGNNKIHRYVGIFNMNSATDCPNADSSESDESDTGVCQVPWKMCYAHKAENMYKDALPKRRRQEFMWDHVDYQTFADALLIVKERKNNPLEVIRFSESGDFRHVGDIIKVNQIAKRLEGEIDVYTYSASHKLDWSKATHFTVNQSNNLADYGDRQFMALEKGTELPEDTVWCPFDYSDKEGDERPMCGECRLCIDKEGPNVAIELH